MQAQVASLRKVPLIKIEQQCEGLDLDTHLQPLKKFPNVSSCCQLSSFDVSAHAQRWALESGNSCHSNPYQNLYM